MKQMKRARAFGHAAGDARERAWWTRFEDDFFPRDGDEISACAPASRATKILLGEHDE